MIAKVRIPTESTLKEFAEKPDKDIASTSFAEKKMDIEIKMVHEGEVNRARFMPQKYNIIASMTNTGEVHIFDYTQHSQSQSDSTVATPQLRLQGHTKEGYGLSWSNLNEGKLLSGSYDNSICLWDIQKPPTNETLRPEMLFRGHEAPVEDVCWNKRIPNLFASVGDDKQILIWDTREDKSKPTHSIFGHSDNINSIDFTIHDDYLFLTGSSDKSVKFWDLRNPSKSIHTFESHEDEVIRVEFSPYSAMYFASCSSDRRVMVWDISKCGSEIENVDAMDGPPELLFIHGGHRARIPDFSWNANHEMMLASVEEENNIVQVWKMSENIYAGDENGNAMDEEKTN